DVIPESLKRLPFMISEPKASLIERMGQQVDLNRVTVLPLTKSAESLGNGYYVIDSGLYNSNEKKMIFESRNKLYFDKTAKNILQASNKKLFSLNLDSGVTLEIDLGHYVGNISNIELVDTGLYLVSDCDSLLGKEE